MRLVLPGMTFATLAATALLSLPAFAAPPETPEGFVRRVYAQYRANGPGVPTDRKGGAPYYAAALLDLFAKDQALANGEVGAIDGDPVCNCQDFGKLRIKSLAVTKGDGDTLKARVDFSNLQYRETVTLTLAQTPAGWRIADVANKGMPSVVAVLQDEIAHPVQDTPGSGAKPAAPKT